MKINKKFVTLLSLVLMLTLAIGGTLAFIIAKSNDVNNTFEPGVVECVVTEDGANDNDRYVDNVSVKKDVAVKNTGNIKAYIRAAVVVTWQKEVTENGQTTTEIYPKAPVAGVDYEISFNENEQQSTDQSNFTTGKWVKNGNYYYWNQPVLSEDESQKCFTGILITSCEPVDDKTPEGYHLVVEVLASAIQADGVTDTDVKAVVDAWGIDPAALGGSN